MGTAKDALCILGINDITRSRGSEMSWQILDQAPKLTGETFDEAFENWDLSPTTLLTEHARPGSCESDDGIKVDAT